MNTKKIIAVMLLIIFILSSGILGVVSYAATEDGIVLNSKLYTAIKNNLQKGSIVADYNDAQYTIKISSEEIAKVKELKLSNGGIYDLSGLENFSSVTWVDLSSNKISDDTDLSPLNSLNLSYLDLSSNQLSDISSITGINQIQTLNLHNQTVTTTNIICNSEVNEGKTKATIDLPQIVNQFGRPLDIEWFDFKYEEGSSNGLEFSVSSMTANSNSVDLAIGDGSTKYTGLATIMLNVKDDTNKLYNSKFTIYTVVINEDERAIVVKDKNLYEAIKKNLIQGQDINNDLKKYTDTNNLYEHAYDEQQIFVIKEDDLVNKITSLKLANKRIKDLSGIEMFVGLEEELDVSSNYINTIQKVLDLQDMKDEEEAKLQTRFKEQAGYLKKELTDYEKLLGDLTNKQKEHNEKYAQYTAETDEAKKAEKQQGLEKSANEFNTLSGGPSVTWNYEINDNTVWGCANLGNKRRKLINRLTKIYKLYNNIYQVTSPITPDLRNITDEEYKNLNLATAKSLLEKQIAKIKSIEKYFTQDEKNYIQAIYSLTYTDENPTPLSKHFEDNMPYWSESGEEKIITYKDELMKLREFDAFCRISNCCFFAGVNGINRSKHNDGDALGKEEALKRIDGEKFDYLLKTSDHWYNSGDSGSPYCIYRNPGSTVLKDWSDAAVNISGRLANASEEDISAYIVLPRLHNLKMHENSIENIDGIEKMKELRSLDMGENEIVNINNVNWTDIIWLNTLDLSFNNISEIKALENIAKMKNLNLSKNLIHGKLDYVINHFDRLEKLNLSENQIDDISELKEQFKSKAYAAHKELNEYILEVVAGKIDLTSQELAIDIELDEKKDSVTIELPLIFRQIEEINWEATSFGTNSFRGNVSADGKQVTLYNPPIGAKVGQVFITGTQSIGFETYCEISTSAKSNGSSNNNDGQVQINVNTGAGSSVSDVKNVNDANYIIVSKGTTVGDLLKDVTLNTDQYNLVVKDSNAQNELNSTDKVTTNSTILINGYNGNVQSRIVVKGDVTGDGDVTFVDVIKLNQAQFDKDSLSDAEILAGDFDGNKSITFSDVLQLNGYYMQKQ